MIFPFKPLTKAVKSRIMNVSTAKVQEVNPLLPLPFFVIFVFSRKELCYETRV